MKFLCVLSKSMFNICVKKISRKDVAKHGSSEFIRRVLSVSRVSTTTSGGRQMSVSVLVVIGNQNGIFGFGLGNAADMKAAENKALKRAQGNLYVVPYKKIVTSSGERRTIHHHVSGSWSGSKISLFSAKAGTSVVGCTTVRYVFECLGITDIVTKIHRSSNPHNVLKAILDALSCIRTQKYYKLLLNSVSSS